MENLKIRCKTCNREIEGHPTKTVACGCSNMATVRVNTYVSALDLSKIVMLNSIKSKEETSLFTTEDIAWQEARRQRKVRRLDFEVR
jgi:hypothetical protein